MGRAVGTSESLRAALASFAADSSDNTFPAADHIRDYATLRAIVNQNGGTLKATEAEMGITFVSYGTHDTDADGVADSYVLTLVVVHENHRQQLVVAPEGITRGDLETVAHR